MKYLTRKEELILLTVAKLTDMANLVSIRERLITDTGHKWSVGNVYVPLDKLSRNDYLQVRIGAPTAKRGGKAVKFYSLSSKGTRALAELKKLHDSVWDKVPDYAYKG